MKLVCKKNFDDISENDIVIYITREQPIFLQRPGKTYPNFPIGTIQKNQNDTPRFIFLDQLLEYFCTIQEYRKLKLNKIQNEQSKIW